MLGAIGAVRTRSLIGRATLKECLCAADTERLAVASTGRARRCYLVADAACDVIRLLVARLPAQHPDALTAIPGDQHLTFPPLCQQNLWVLKRIPVKRIISGSKRSSSVLNIWFSFCAFLSSRLRFMLLQRQILLFVF